MLFARLGCPFEVESKFLGAIKQHRSFQHAISATGQLFFWQRMLFA
jgi:hypothetical protein